ncbi:hypothetical protein [Fructobacillus americanaquae]|uniref:Glycosyltransferase RgtA/B/C/D-like domain-containing protein n=1 Tax=Fructobacillus americanaquae TaxID=2940302 RepID=A0ABY5C097_9LACO|nr:hypothetical protein [Fructobacillus americanaquae]USS92184.1 hypothetical protein M3M36_00795 [Fructobacillus americanaquae]
MFIKRSFQIAFSAFIVLLLLNQALNQHLENLIAILLLLPALIASYSAIMHLDFVKKPAFLLVVTVLCTALNLLLLLYVALRFQINDVSDPLNVQIKATELLHGNQNWHSNFDGSQEYFYVYPNLVFFTILISKVMVFAQSVGLSIQLALRLMNFFLLAMVTIFTLLTSWRLSKNIRALASTAVILLFYPVMYLYPNMVTYTDTWAISCTTVVFYLVAVVLTSQRRLVIVGANLALILVYGLLYAIKPNMVILLPAVLSLIFMTFFLKMPEKWRVVLIAISLALGIVMATMTTKSLASSNGYSQSAQKKIALPTTHWINMGLNPFGSSGKGAYDSNDESLDIERKLEKKTYLTMDSIKDRLQMLGLAGWFKLALDKSQTLLGTPLFGFGRYASGYDQAPGYYLHHQVMLTTFFTIIATTTVLLVGGQLLIKVWQPYENQPITTNQRAFTYLIGLAAIGLTIFHTFIWEVEPRYFLPMLYPVITLIGMVGGVQRLPALKIVQLQVNVNWTKLLVWPIASILFLELTLSSAKSIPGIAYGNMEYPIRLEILQPVKAPVELRFSLPVPETVNVLKVNIRPEPGQRVSLSTGQQLIPRNGHYTLEKRFAANQNVEIFIHRDDTKTKRPLILYRQPPLYKQLFHGSSVTIDGQRYYLPYEMDIYDRKPFELLDVNNSPVLR